MSIDLAALSAATADTALGGRIHAALILVASQKSFEGDTEASNAAQDVFADPSGEGHKYRLAVIAHTKIIASLPEIDDATIIEVVTELWEKGTFRQ